jgi:cytoskeletal protein RodZ
MSDLGDLLRRARAHKGVTLRDAEKRTRISRTYLAALEAHDFDQLPPRAYARGIVRNYAQYLGLDPAAILSMYEQAVRDDTGEVDDVEVVAAVQPIEIHGHWAPNFAIIIFMLVISAVIFTWIYSAYLQPADNDIPDTITQPTATAVEESLLETILQTASPTETVEAEATAPLEGGGTDSPTSTPEAPADGSTAAPQDETPLEEATPEPEGEAPGPDIDILPDDIVVPDGYHVFAVYAEDEVWVYVTLDNEIVALDRVLAAGQTEMFLAQSATITSGNAAFVRVFVDGEDWGTLGEPWDAVVTYP